MSSKAFSSSVLDADYLEAQKWALYLTYLDEYRKSTNRQISRQKLAFPTFLKIEHSCPYCVNEITLVPIV